MRRFLGLLITVVVAGMAPALARADVIPDDPGWTPPPPPACTRGARVQHVFRGHGGQACVSLDCTTDADCAPGTGPCAPIALCTKPLPDYAMLPQGARRPDWVMGECGSGTPPSTCASDTTCTTSNRCIGRAAPQPQPQPQQPPPGQPPPAAAEDDSCTVAAPGLRSAIALPLALVTLAAAVIWGRRRRV